MTKVINRQELQKALEIVKPGLSTKDIIEQSTSFVFLDDRIVTYNDEIGISHPVSGMHLKGAIYSEELISFLSKLKRDDIEVEEKEAEIIFTCGRSIAGFTLKKEIKLPLKEIGDIGEWEELPEGFGKAIRFAMSSCSKNITTTPILTCVHVNKEGLIEGSDGFRIGRYFLKNIPFTFLIPAKSAAIVQKMKPTHIAKGDGWVHFLMEEGTVVSARVFKDKYANTEPHFSVEGHSVKFPKTIGEIVERASVFSKRDHFLDEELDVTLSKNRISIRAQSEHGWFEEKGNMSYEGTAISFKITPYLFQDILEETQDCIIGTTKLRFETNDWIYIAALRIGLVK